MLQSIRERAQGVIAWFIVILISVPFALWGIQEYLGVGSEPVVATVNGQEITEREFDQGYRDFRQSLRQRLGDKYRPEMLDEVRLKEEVLEAMIRNRIILQTSERLGLTVGDDFVREMILQIPSFQVDGRFNQDAYERGVRVQGLTPAGFEAQLRLGLVSEQLSKAISGSEFTTRDELQDLVRLRQQRREFEYLTIPTDAFTGSVSVDESEIQSHYETNQKDYMMDERVKLRYLDLEVDAIAKTLSVDGDTLLGYYEQNREQYMSPAQRAASHILITVDEGADEVTESAAREAAQAALDRVRGGEEFAVVAKEVSQDPGSADMGGDLGFFESGVMDKAFEDAVFSMQEGEISDPVRSQFGYHVIKLTGIRPPQGKSFDEARADVEKAYLRSEAERLFYEYAERLSDLAYEDPDSLEPAAEALGMKVAESDWMTRSGGEGVLASPKVIGAAFSEDVLLEGHNSEAIELSPQHIVVLRVAQHEEAAVRPLDMVRELISDQLKRRQAAVKVEEAGQSLITRMQEGASLQALAEESGYVLGEQREINRDERELPPELVQQVYTMARPADGGSSYGQVRLANGDSVLLVLHKVVDGTLEDANEIGGEAAIISAMERSRGKSYFEHMQSNLRQAAEVEIPKKQE
jgi:peptidyl-prolyl cis-trans isomerase D